MANQQYLDELADMLLSLENRQNMLSFLDGILTPQELTDISQRLQIVKELKQGRPQREIAENLGVGIATVTRGSREIKKGKFESVKV